MGICGFLLLDFHGGGLVAERTDKGVPVAILCDGDWDLGLDDGVDTADLVCDLPGALEEKRVADVAFVRGHGW